MEKSKEQLFLIPKGSNGLRLHPRAFVDENMKSYEKVTGILLSTEEVDKLEAEKKEILEALEGLYNSIQRLPDIEYVVYGKQIESLIQKHKPCEIK